MIKEGSRKLLTKQSFPYDIASKAIFAQRDEHLQKDSL